MIPDQKFEFLHQWCENLSATSERREQEIRGLHDRLLKVEAALRGMSDSPTR
jgi:hypothetical protein